MNDHTLYERLGGREAIGAVVDEFYDRVLDDDRVAHHFEDVDMTAQRAHQTRFLSAVAGGPAEYDGDTMDEAHDGMGITGTEFGAIATHLDDALAEFDVDDADREAVLAAVEEFRDDIVEAE
ncbi:group I truncated hemoglobin [Halorubrum lipolyticum]|uniref:Globin n=1 Tax=Halorubrum lipolyticum DSM 21995 TaxID=1227482 RepID=M0NVX5_9EURY|nr:group 1 truncated hemoglobin [Halorubrum lipolyticum]EMA61961.1 globin [Halorubrum lipolyticum DSM 21995]